MSEARRVENIKALLVLFLSNTKESLDIGCMPVLCEFPEVFP